MNDDAYIIIVNGREYWVTEYADSAGTRIYTLTGMRGATYVVRRFTPNGALRAEYNDGRNPFRRVRFTDSNGRLEVHTA